MEKEKRSAFVARGGAFSFRGAAFLLGSVMFAGVIILHSVRLVVRLHVESQCRATWSSLPPVHAAVGTLPVDKQILSATGGRLSPGKRGLCLFHGQVPHNQDRGIFERLGGHVDHACCIDHPIAGIAPFLSTAQLCPCVAPADPSAFDQSFLEIGALDGQFLSNLLFFESQMGWRGLCVEGSPQNFPYLARNRPQCSVVNGVIGDDVGTNATFFTFSKGVDSWERSMSCMMGSSVCADLDAAKAYAKQTETILLADTVPMYRLADLFRERKMRKMGWIMVDVEGAERIVLGTVDWREVCARYVSYEGERASVKSLLLDAGYVETDPLGVDTLMVPGPLVKCS